MTPERWQMVRGILASAMELRLEERDAYLDRQCASNPPLRKDVDEYLSIDGKLDQEFLEKPDAEHISAVATTAMKCRLCSEREAWARYTERRCRNARARPLSDITISLRISPRNCRA